jgi:hypothetical protein
MHISLEQYKLLLMVWISEDDKVWNMMFEPLADGEYLAMRKNKTLTN